PHSGSPQVAHCGRSSAGILLQSSLSPICTRSSSSWARTWCICSSTAASISAHVALGCSFLHSVIPSRSRSPALTCWICSTRLPFILLGFHALIPLSVFSSSLPPSAFLQKNEPHPSVFDDFALGCEAGSTYEIRQKGDHTKNCSPAYCPAAKLIIQRPPGHVALRK